MSYSQIVFEDRPIGYWDGPQLSRSNVLTENQYSIESSTAGWSALDNTTISRVTTDAWHGSASLRILCNNTNPSGIRMAAGSRVDLSPGIYYSMIARVKNITGVRKAAIRVEYFTTQSGSTQTQTVKTGPYFDISDTEWTTIYHTDIVSGGEINNSLFASWGIVTDSGSASDSLLCDGIQLFEGSPFSVYDHINNNDAVLLDYKNEVCKPIVFGGDAAIKFNSNTNLSIDNTNLPFVYGKEKNTFSIDFWFSLERYPLHRHYLVSFGPGIQCYVEQDKIYLQYEDKITYVQVDNWDNQYYINIIYSNRELFLYVNNNRYAGLSLGTEFNFVKFPDISYKDVISFGPAALGMNLITNGSLNSPLGEDFLWNSKNSSVSVISSDYYSGGKCLEITKQASNNSGVTYGDLIPVMGYRHYYLSAYIKIPSGEELGTIRLLCNQYNSMYDGTESIPDVPVKTLLRSSQEDFEIVDNDWHRISLPIFTNYDVAALEVEIIQPDAGTNGEKFLIDSIVLEESRSLSKWDYSFSETDSLYVNCIGIYSYDIGNERRSKRYEYGSKDSVDFTAVEKNSDKFESFYSPEQITCAYDVFSDNNLLIEGFNNIAKVPAGVGILKTAPETIEYGVEGGDFLVYDKGLKLFNSAYLTLKTAANYFNPNSSTIRWQADFDPDDDDGVMVVISPILNGYGIIIKKIDNKIVGQVVVDPLLTPSLIFETDSLSNGELNIALNFSDQNMSIKINSQEFNNVSIPSIILPVEITIGNLPGNSDPYPNYIRNFAIDKLTSFNEIDWLEDAAYMLRFNGSLEVSQKSTLRYVSPNPISGNNSLIVADYIGFNNSLTVNGSIIKETTNIPNFNYLNPQSISYSLELYSRTSTEDVQSIYNNFLVVIDSTAIPSSLGKFFIRPNESSGSIVTNSYIPKIFNYNILSKSKNIGIRFNKSISTGCKITAETDAEIKYLEFVFKINDAPINSELYTIFDIDSIAGLYLNDSGLVKSGTYNIYIDGVLVTNVSSQNIVYGEFYHCFIEFPSTISTNIQLGAKSDATDVLDGSLGRINVYSQEISNLSSFISNKYDDILGRKVIEFNGETININDSDITQSYEKEIDYYEMKKLPKVKIVTDL